MKNPFEGGHIEMKLINLNPILNEMLTNLC